MHPTRLASTSSPPFSSPHCPATPSPPFACQQDGEAAQAAAIAGPEMPRPTEPRQQRLLIVANRLPVHVRKGGDNEWLLQVSAGGLVSALLGVGNFQTKWIGWPGIYIESKRERASMTRALGKADYVPVFLDTVTFDQVRFAGLCSCPSRHSLVGSAPTHPKSLASVGDGQRRHADGST